MQLLSTAFPRVSGKMNVYRASDQFEVVGLAEPKAELRKRADKNSVYKGVKRMEVEELLNTPGLQAVAVETEVRDLLRYAEMCIDAGMDDYLSKPVSPSKLVRKVEQWLKVDLSFYEAG